MPLTPSIKQRSTVYNILITGLLTGTLDGLAAMILNYKVDPARIFKFIASGAFGKAAFAGGAEMVVAGVVFHYIIALSFSAAFYLLYPFFKSGLKNKYLVGFIYGIATWLIMNLIVVPSSKIGPFHIPVKAILIGMTVLTICVGIPIALMAERQYKKNSAVGKK